MDIADKIAEKLEIDPKKPTFDMVFTWVGLGPDMKEVKKTKAIKWQPGEPISKWRDFELKLVEAAINGNDGFDIAKILPPMPYQSANSMFYKYGLPSTSDLLLARVEIVLLKDRLSLVIYDNLKYTTAKSMFWEEYGKALSEKLTIREDFAEYSKANAEAIAEAKESPLRAAGKWWYPDMKPIRFKMPEIQQAWENEEPAVAAWRKQNEKGGQGD